MTQPIVSVDELLVAVETTLRAHLAATVEALGFEDLGAIKDWQQLPTADSIATADLPAVTVTSPGLAELPNRRADGTFLTTWRVSIGIYARGRDHADTQARVRNWCAAIRTTLLTRKSLGGIASSMTWKGEDYALIPGRSSARTFGAGEVDLDVTVTVTTDPTTLPVVTTTGTNVSVQ